MLDTEPTGGTATGETPSEQTADTTSTTTTSPTRRRAPRKATRSSGAPAVDAAPAADGTPVPAPGAPEDPTPPDVAVGEPSPDGPAADRPAGEAPVATGGVEAPVAEAPVAEAPAPPKRTRARKTAAPAAPRASAAAREDEPGPAAGSPELAGAVAPAPGEAGAPVRSAPEAVGAPRKRARKKAAPAAAPVEPAGGPQPEQADSPGQHPQPGQDPKAGQDPQPPEGEDETAGQVEPRGRRSRAPRPPVALFMAPEPVVPELVEVEDEAEAVEARDPADVDIDAGAVEAPRRRSRSRRRPPTAEDQPSEGPAAEEAVEAAPETDDAGAEGDDDGRSRRKRRGRRGRGRGRGGAEDGEAADGGGPEAGEDAGTEPDADADDDVEADAEGDAESAETGEGGTRRRRRRRRRGGGDDPAADDPPATVVRVREPREPREPRPAEDEVQGVKGSTRLEAKRQRRRDGRDQSRRRPPVLSESEFLARREAVERVMAVRRRGERTQIAVLEDDVLVEHYVTKASAAAFAGNVYLGRVQNVLPSMEAAFVDIGKGRNAVLYAGEVNWDAAGMEGRPRRIEQALRSGDTVLVQVTKDPIGHKGARLTSQISLPGRFLVYVPEGQMTGISRKLPDTERKRLKDILKKIVPENAGVIIRTAAEGASEEELTNDVARLEAQWQTIKAKAEKGSAPALLSAEPDLVIRVIRDIFNEDFARLVVQGDEAWEQVSSYVEHVSPDLVPRLSRWTAEGDVFAELRVDEQIAKALDRKVYLPSGGSLVIDRTEAMTVVDVNTGKYTGQGGNLEETVTRNNLEAAEEVVRQLRLRDIGGMIVIDFIDMVLEGNRDLVLRRLTECLGRDRTKHQVAEVTSLGLVQMTRKRVGQGLLEVFSEPCEHCNGRGVLVRSDPWGDRSKPKPAPPPGIAPAAQAVPVPPAPPVPAPAAPPVPAPLVPPAPAASAPGLEPPAADGSSPAVAGAEPPAAGEPAPARGRRRRRGADDRPPAGVPGDHTSEDEAGAADATVTLGDLPVEVAEDVLGPEDAGEVGPPEEELAGTVVGDDRVGDELLGNEVVDTPSRDVGMVAPGTLLPEPVTVVAEPVAAAADEPAAEATVATGAGSALNGHDVRLAADERATGTEGPSAPRRRPRRAASRPAGPPPATD